MDPSKRHEEYEIIIKGYLDTTWAEWFSGLAIKTLPNGTTRILGLVTDQSELHGILEKIRDLNIELISLRRK